MKRIWATALAVVCWAVAPPAARADAELNKAADKLAAEIETALKDPKVKENGTKVRVQAGESAGRVYTNYMSGVVARLTRQLESKGLYDEKSPLRAVVSVGTVKGDKLATQFGFQIKDDGTEPLATGKTVGYPDGGTWELPRDEKFVDSESFERLRRNAQERAAPKPPSASNKDWTVSNPILSGTKFLASTDGRFAVEIEVTDAAKGRQPGKRGISKEKGHDGIEFVDIQTGDQFVLIVHNTDNDPVVVAVEMDGIDVFNAVKEKGTPAVSGFVVPPKSTLEIPGWRKTMSEWNQFAVFDYRDSVAAAVFKDSPKPALGQITLSFTPVYRKNVDAIPASGGSLPDGAGIGEGRKRKLDTTLVDLKVLPNSIATMQLRYRGPAANNK